MYFNLNGNPFRTLMLSGQVLYPREFRSSEMDTLAVVLHFYIPGFEYEKNYRFAFRIFKLVISCRCLLQ